MKKSLLFMFSVLLLAACSDDSELPDVVEEVGEKFEEGQIDIEVRMQGSPVLNIMAEMYSQLDPSRDMDEQMEEFMSNLAEEERQAFIDFAEAFEDDDTGLGQFGYMMSILFLPLIDNVVFVKQDDALAKFEGLTYRGENKVNYNTQSGQYYMQSRWDEQNQISFTYKEEDFSEGFAQQPINDDLYNIQQTNETEIIAGYTCRQQVYTAKSQETSPYKLEVWTSQLMPKSVNFLHPYYMRETGGIMKITAHLTHSMAFPIVYEFKTVTPRAVTDGEMAIKEVAPLYNFNDDPIGISFKIFGILFAEN